MDLPNVFGTAVAFIASLGGGAAIVMGASSWLGKVWAERFMEKDRAKHAQGLQEMKHEHSQELEELKTRFARELEYYRNELSRVAARFERYDARQFETYGRIWEALYDLKLAADELWDEASRNNLVNFKRQLQEALDTTGKLSLYIEDGHYRELRGLLNTFANFETGKHRLVELRRDRGLPQGYDHGLVQQQIEINRHTKDQYDRLIETIRVSFKAHMSVPVHTAALTQPDRQERTP